MPTFSAIELDNLVEPRGVRDSYKKPLAFSPPRSRVPGALHGRETAAPPPLRHIYISPALYATPEPAPIPEMVTEPLSPSPYVVNHKRRGGGTGAFGNRGGTTDGIEVPAGEKKEKEKETEGADLIEAVEEEEEALTTEVADEKFSGDGANEFFVKKNEVVEEEEEDGFLDTRCDSVSIGSETEGIRQFDSRSFLSSTHGEFFDAIEDFSSDSAISSSPLHAPNFEPDLRALRLSLLEEIERRKEAEDNFNSMRCQWQRIGDLLSGFGIKLPIIALSSGDIQLEDASIENLSQELAVHRYVAQTLGKAEGRVEAELAAEAILQCKDQEISRLRDRLQYYEAVNREMSQRNQEIIEVARKRRQRRKTWWFWGCMGASVAIGISALAYAYTNSHQDVSSTSKATSDANSCQAD